MVRRTAAANLPNIAEPHKADFIISTLLPIWQALLKDATDSVRVQAIEVSDKIIAKLTKQQVADNFVAPLKEVLSQKNKSWRIRYAVAEILEILASNLGKQDASHPPWQSLPEREVSRKELVSMLESLLKDSELEVRSFALNKLLVISPQLNEGVLASNILPILNGLVQDTSQHVRSSLGEILCGISPQFEAKNVVSGILPILESLLKDEVLDVRLSVMSNIRQLNKHIGNELVKKHVIPLFGAI